MENATEKQIAFLKKKGFEIPEGMSKSMAHEMIENFINKPKTTILEMPEKTSFKKPDGQSSFYVSYAKDIFIAMVPRFENGDLDADALMQDCIKCIKMAKEQL